MYGEEQQRYRAGELRREADQWRRAREAQRPAEPGPGRPPRPVLARLRSLVRSRTAA